MQFEHLVDELKGTTSRIEKEEILEYYIYDIDTGNFIKFLLREAFDPNLLHHVLIQKKAIPEPGPCTLGEVKRDIINLFAELHLELSPQKNKLEVLKVMEELTEASQMALLAVVNKKLNAGISIKTLNKVHGDFIQVIPIQLAKKYSPDEAHKYSNAFFASDKLDGQRVFCIRDFSEWKKYSRAGDYLGSEITTLGHWDEDLEKYYALTGMSYLDGEAYKHGMIFEDITSLIKSSVNKKDATSLLYHIFFVGKTRDIMETAKKNEIAGIPPETLYQTFKDYRYLVGVKQKRILNDEVPIYQAIDEAVAAGYEGIILRSTEKTYDFKRSHCLLKAKKSDLSGTEEESDCYVEDIEYGDFQIRENGIESIEVLPVALQVVLVGGTGKQMRVGSGFSLKQRREWADEESRIVAHIIEVTHQGYGKKGGLRFPRFGRVRTDL